MIIIKLIGGLGNQMFQYALYLKFKNLGKNVKLDVSSIDEKKIERIDQFFNLELPIATRREILSVQQVNVLYYVRGFHRIYKMLNKKPNIYYDKEVKVQLKVLELDNIYLEGYWQSEKYFLDIEENIRKMFVMKNRLTDYQKDILDKIRSTESISVHIRRGDYLKFSNIYGGICTAKYYEKAFQHFKGKNVHFFIFSNDYEFVKKNFSDTNIIVVKPEMENSMFCNMDLYLMSSCKHNIIANSTFSWWGAWLNSNPEKIVIAPTPWINTREIEDIYCENWIKLNSN